MGKNYLLLAAITGLSLQGMAASALAEDPPPPVISRDLVQINQADVIKSKRIWGVIVARDVRGVIVPRTENPAEHIKSEELVQSDLVQYVGLVQRGGVEYVATDSETISEEGDGYILIDRISGIRSEYILLNGVFTVSRVAGGLVMTTGPESRVWVSHKALPR